MLKSWKKEKHLLDVTTSNNSRYLLVQVQRKYRDFAMFRIIVR